MSNETKQKGIIDELIEKVDDPICGWTPLSIGKNIQINIIKIMILGILFFYLGILYYAVTSLLPPINTPEDLLPIVIALSSFILSFCISIKELIKPLESEERIRVTTNWNYKRIKKSEKKERWLLLKALIRMRTLQRDFKLSEVRRKYPSLFNEENLIGMLYTLSPLSVKMYGEKKIEANIKAKKEDDEKTDTNSLIAEYRVLNEAVWRRGRDSLVVNSIMIPASLAIVTFAIRFRSDLGRNILFSLPNAGFVPLVSLILIFIPYFLWYITTKLDNICFNRIYEIEDILHIKGNKWVLEQINCKTWYKVRRHMWHVFYLLLIGTYLFTAYWLFRETILV